MTGTTWLVFGLIALLVIAMVFMALSHLTSRVKSSRRSMHRQQAYYYWTWQIAQYLEVALVAAAYAQWGGHSLPHHVLVVWMWIGLGLLVLEYIILMQVPNRFHGSARKLPK